MLRPEDVPGAVRRFLFRHQPESWPAAPGPDVQRLFAALTFLAEFEAAPAASIPTFQRDRLALVVQQALRCSAGWRARLAAAATGAALAFEHIPIIDRAELRRLIDADGPLPTPSARGPIATLATSGSTGVPMRLYRDRHAVRLAEDLYLLDHFRHGRDPSRPMASLIPRFPKDDMDGGFAPVNGLNPVECGPAYLRRSPDRTPERSWADHLHWLATVPAAYLMTTPAVLRGLLEAIAAGGPAPRLEQIVTFGEVVDPELRQQARARLGAAIVDRYSCTEIGPIAFQCPLVETTYHVSAVNAVVEIVDAEGRPCPPGVLGRVVVSGLFSEASPILRYDLGDLAAWSGPCPCGSALPGITRLLGRRRALLRHADGGWRILRLNGGDLVPVAPIREYRVVQTTVEQLVAEVVAERPLSAAEAAALAARIEARAGPGFRCVVAERDAIDWGPSPKRQDIVSLVD